MPGKARNVIGPQLRRIRAQQELSQEALAVRLQLAGLSWSRQAVAKVEARIRQVNDAEFSVLACVLGVPMPDLLPETRTVRAFLAQTSL